MIAQAIVKTLGLSRSTNIENPNVPLTAVNVNSWLGGRGVTRSGLRVGIHDALGHSPIWAAVSIISEDIMRIPWLTHEKKIVDGRETRERAKNHPVYRLLRRETARTGEPSRMTSNMFIQRMLVHALLHGNAYARIHRAPNRGQSRPYRIEWLHSDRVRPDIIKGQKVYNIKYDGVHDEPGEDIQLRDEDIFHLEGLSLDELGGLSIIGYARNSIGRQIAAELFGEEFFKNHAVPQGFFAFPNSMKGDAWLRMKKLIELQHGQGNWHTFGVLPDGAKWEKTGINASDAMLVDMMKFGAPEASRWYKVPLHKLGDPSRQGYNTTEEDNRNFLASCLGNWISKLEFQANDKLFTEREKERDQYFTEFKTDAYTRGDVKSRMEANAIAIQNGIKSRNEVRAEDNLNAYEGGDEFLVPMNMDDGQNTDDEPESDSQPADDQNDDERGGSQRLAYLRDASIEPLQRMAKRLCNAARVAAKKPNSFLSYINELEDHRGVIEDAIRPIAKVIAVERREDPDEITSMLANGLVVECREEFLQASECQPEELSKRVGQAAGNISESFIPNLIDGLLFEEVTA